jgi:hypothetical protein
MTTPATDDATKEIARLTAINTELLCGIALAYGYLWHVNNESGTPAIVYSPEKAAYEARKVLRDLLMVEQRGNAIDNVRATLRAADGEQV